MRSNQLRWSTQLHPRFESIIHWRHSSGQNLIPQPELVTEIVQYRRHFSDIGLSVGRLNVSDAHNWRLPVAFKTLHVPLCYLSVTMQVKSGDMSRFYSPELADSRRLTRVH